MSLVRFDSVTFAYPESRSAVFVNLDLELPGGVVSLVGQNGVGKSTLLLLAGGRLLPDAGVVTMVGKPTTELVDEAERNRLASFVYQNMEFETDESIGELMDYVLENGAYEKKPADLIPQLTRFLELSQVLGRRTQEISKGELQRVIIAFSLLYGSPLVLMDEPVFALEERQKESVLDFLLDHSRRTGVNICYSMHELELTRKYSDRLLLFSKDGRIETGETKSLFTREKIEEAYQVPYSLLHQKENLHRERLRDPRTSPPAGGPKPASS